MVNIMNREQRVKDNRDATNIQPRKYVIFDITANNAYNISVIHIIMFKSLIF